MAIAACLVLGVSTIWLAGQNRQLRSQRTAVALPPRPVPAPQMIASIVLGSEVTRGTESQVNPVVAGAFEVVKVLLKLNPGEPYSAYAAAVRKRSGEAVWTGEPLRPVGSGTDREVTLWVPAEALPAGNYEIELVGVAGPRREPVGYFSFTVQRE
jgi:hypothetical protein